MAQESSCQRHFDGSQSLVVCRINKRDVLGNNLLDTVIEFYAFIAISIPALIPSGSNTKYDSSSLAWAGIYINPKNSDFYLNCRILRTFFFSSGIIVKILSLTGRYLF